MATGTRNVVLRRWNGRFPDREPAELVRALYARRIGARASPPVRKT